MESMRTLSSNSYDHLWEHVDVVCYLAHVRAWIGRTVLCLVADSPAPLSVKDIADVLGYDGLEKKSLLQRKKVGLGIQYVGSEQASCFLSFTKTGDFGELLLHENAHGISTFDLQSSLLNRIAENRREMFFVIPGNEKSEVIRYMAHVSAGVGRSIIAHLYNEYRNGKPEETTHSLTKVVGKGRPHQIGQRLSRLCSLGIVEKMGMRKDTGSNQMCSVYALNPLYTNIAAAVSKGLYGSLALRKY
jgi:hypothetical protein